MSYTIATYFKAHTGGAERNIDRLNRRLKDLGAAAARNSDLAAKWGAAGQRLGSAGRWLTTRVTLPAVLAGAAFVRSAGQMEQWRIGFSNILRDAEKGEKIMWRLVRLADATPFVDQTIIGSATQLLGAGMNEQKTLDTIKMLGDITSGIGGNDQTLNRLVQGYSKAFQKQQLNMEAIEPFMTAGTGMVGKVADMFFGGDTQKLLDEMSKGNVHFDMLTAAMRDATGESGRFQDAMKKQSETILGLWSTLQGKSFTTSSQLGDFIAERWGVKPKIRALSDWVVQLGDGVKNMSEAQKTFTTGAATTAVLAGPATLAFAAYAKAMAGGLLALSAGQYLLAGGALTGASATAVAALTATTGKFVAAGFVLGKAVIAGIAGGIGYAVGSAATSLVPDAVWDWLASDSFERERERNAALAQELKGDGMTEWANISERYAAAAAGRAQPYQSDIDGDNALVGPGKWLAQPQIDNHLTLNVNVDRNGAVSVDSPGAAFPVTAQEAEQ